MNKKMIISFILGILVASTTAYTAYKYQASEVEYTPNNENFKVENVEDAINELYKKATTGPTMENVLGATHQGIVYLDPTDLTKKCTASNSVSTTETKTGCMKWYIFKSDDTSYTMILDHNTTAIINWNDNNKNVAVGSSNVASELTSLVNTSGWKVTPRLITADEVNSIVGGVSTWNVSNGNTWFYFEGTGTNNQTMPEYSATKRSKYAWLYDNLLGCRGGYNGTDYGCDVEDNRDDYVSKIGNGYCERYWTSSTEGAAGSGSAVWAVGSSGQLVAMAAIYYPRGVRPVITISKSAIK